MKHPTLSATEGNGDTAREPLRSGGCTRGGETSPVNGETLPWKGTEQSWEGFPLLISFTRKGSSSQPLPRSRGALQKGQRARL